MRVRGWSTFAVALILTTGAPAVAEEVTLRIAPERSEAAFDATWPFGDFTGTTKDVKGDIRFDPTDLTKPVVAQVEVNPSTLGTGISGRDKDLRDYMEVERFPTIQFAVKEIRATSPSLLDQPEVPIIIVGRMTIHGVERLVEFSGKARYQEGRLRVEAATALRMTDYGIKPPTKLFLRVGDEIKVRFQAEAVKR